MTHPSMRRFGAINAIVFLAFAAPNLRAASFEQAALALDPVAYYTFDDVNFGTVANSGSQTTKTGAIQAGASITADIDGRHGSGLAVASNADGLWVNNGEIDLSGTNDWTIGVWYKDLHTVNVHLTLARGIKDHHVIMFNSAGDYDLGMFDNTHVPVTFFDSGYDAKDVSTGWHFLVAIGDVLANQTHFYIDGDFVGTAGSSTGENIEFIGGVVGNQPFAKTLDDFLVYDKALTQAEITNLWDARDGIAVPVPTAAALGFALLVLIPLYRRARHV